MARDPKRTDVVRITTAAENRAADIRTRQRRYLASMGLRTICFVGAIIVGHGIFMWILIFGAVFLPYVAVVLANAATTKDDGFALTPGLSDRRSLSGPGAGASGAAGEL